MSSTHLTFPRKLTFYSWIFESYCVEIEWSHPLTIKSEKEVTTSQDALKYHKISCLNWRVVKMK